MDRSSALAAQPQPQLSRDEKCHLFEEQKQRRLERFSAGAPFSGSGRMGKDVEQIQDKAYELHLQGSPTSHVVGACATHLPGTKRRSCMEEDEDNQQQASATKRSRVAIGECSNFVPPGNHFNCASCSSRRVSAPHPQAPPPLPLPPPPTSSSSSSSSSNDWQHKALWLEHRAQAEGTQITHPRENEGEEEEGGMVVMAMEEEGLGRRGGGGGESSSWAPLPPRKKLSDRRRGGRSRASSTEIMTS